MADLLEVAQIAYIKACKEFNEAAKRYNDTHINIQENGEINYCSGEAIVPFMCIVDVIHKAVDVYCRLEQGQMTEAERKFMSGVMHVDNIMKHEKDTKVEVWDFVRTHPKFSISKKDGILTTNIQTGFFFEDISFIPVDSKNQAKRNNYNEYIKGKDVVDVLNNITFIIKQYS